MKLLEAFDSEEIEQFALDMKLILSIIKNLDLEYANAKKEFIHDFVNFKHLLRDWNQKYRHLKMSHHEDGMELKLKITITGIKMIDALKIAMGCGELSKVNGKNVAMEETTAGRLFTGKELFAELTFLDAEGKDNSLNLELDKKGNISLIYFAQDLSVAGAPEFNLCAYFALMGYDKEINLQKFSYTFSFSTDFQESEGKGEGYLNRVRLFDRI